MLLFHSVELISVQLILPRENIYFLCESLWCPQATFYMNQGGICEAMTDSKLGMMKRHLVLLGGHQAMVPAWASAVLSVKTPGPQVKVSSNGESLSWVLLKACGC